MQVDLEAWREGRHRDACESKCADYMESICMHGLRASTVKG